MSENEIPDRNLRLGAWVRISVFRGQRHSETFQERDCFDWAKRHHHQVVQTWDEKNISGAKPKRKHLEEILSLLDAGEIDGVIVAYVSRFARTHRVAERFLEEFEKRGGILVCANEDYVIHEDCDERVRDNFNLDVWRAESEWRRKRADWRRIQTAVAKDGVPPQQVPYGYRPTEDRTWVAYEPEARWVRFAYDRRADGWSIKRIARHLNAHDAPPPKTRPSDEAGVKQWTGASLHHLLKRRTYLGTLERHGVTITVPRLITDKQFAQAQVATTVPTAPAGHLLTGILRCGYCRQSLSASGTKRGGTEYVTYRCTKCKGNNSVTERNTLPDVRRQAVIEWNTAPARFVSSTANPYVEKLLSEEKELDDAYESWLDDDRMRVSDPDRWERGQEKRKALYDAKKAERVEAQKAANDVHRIEAQAWPEDREEQRRLIAAAFPVIFLRRQADVPDGGSRFRFFTRDMELPDLPRRGRTFDARPVSFGDDAPRRAGVAEA